MNLSNQELLVFISIQKKIFDTVRLVDVSMATQYSISDNGEIEKQPYECYAIWNKGKRCSNCISAMAFSAKGKFTKFEFVDNQVFFVVSIYAEIDEIPYVIEMVSQLNDKTLFDAHGKNKFIQAIKEQNEKLYIDSLTGAYNRRYYEEQIKILNYVNAVTMIDVDNFKTINDTYGHFVGDVVLKEIVKTIASHIRFCDAIIRMGGDEFLIVFQGITKSILKERLELIKHTVSKISINNHPTLNVSISMGAIYSDDTAIDFVESADKALYKAKQRKNCIVIEDSSNL
ncbi:GGDEF domain-containing protein [Paludicola sp. MB14-C6]|uniref:GGDEF domain-containing protein n=1 Tax=Paludihabitans sp. MB14-C6 TaxID=3070656 RepID=UPI0027DBF888|nr:GGDEF domain-containing protein [Paludicola sp. MB14-C6]WMJ21898.1 GGDEF domain-containing protein [Paludicola sp. MB14-C6]